MVIKPIEAADVPREHDHRGFHFALGFEAAPPRRFTHGRAHRERSSISGTARGCITVLRITVSKLMA